MRLKSTAALVVATVGLCLPNAVIAERLVEKAHAATERFADVAVGGNRGGRDNIFIVCYYEL